MIFLTKRDVVTEFNSKRDKQSMYGQDVQSRRIWVQTQSKQRIY